MKGESIFDQQQAVGGEAGQSSDAVTEETENAEDGKSKVKVQGLTEAEREFQRQRHAC